ncbi:DUF4383 domain-containing protein [bacterium]|nr:DUF4383 domain-containing protein [bacterium]
MRIRNFALWSGVFFLFLGIISFIPWFVSDPAADAPRMNITSAYGQLFAIFPVNSLLNVFHGLLGIIGLLAYRSQDASLSYARWCAGLFGAMSVLGMLFFSRTFAGLLPLYGHNIWLHGIMAIACSYFATRTPEVVSAGTSAERGPFAEARRGKERKPSDLDKAG